MVKIDGSKVRSLRESKGLTQLYIATVVEVTTDTISRWENKRYPSIKEENALKLAEALEVTLDDILEKEDEITKPEETVTVAVPQTKVPKSKQIFLWLMLLFIVLLLPFIWYSFKQPEPVTISATRILPPHIPVGQPFPVIIQVETKQPGLFSLILKETLPANCDPIVSGPPFTGIDKKTGSLKWIARTTGQVTTFVYLQKDISWNQTHQAMHLCDSAALSPSVIKNLRKQPLPAHWSSPSLTITGQMPIVTTVLRMLKSWTFMTPSVGSTM